MKKISFILGVIFIIKNLLYGNVNQSIKQKDFFDNQKKQFEKVEENKKNKIIHYNIDKPKLNDTKPDICFTTNEIKEDNLHLLKKREKEIIFSKYLNKCNSINDLKNLVNELTSLYIDKGFITSKVYLKPQNIASGVVEIHAIEGRVEELADNSLSTKIAFGGIEGEYLNLRDLEVGIENLNRLNSNNAKLKLEPGTKTGLTKVHIENEVSNFINGYLLLNNYGQDETGNNQFALNLNIDNPLGLNDQIRVNYNTTDQHNTAENSIGDTYTYSIPYGRFLYTLQYSNSKYHQIINSQLNKYKIIGKSNNYTGSLKYRWFHNQNHRFSNTISLNHYKTKKYIDSYMIDTSTYNLSKFSIASEYLYQSNSYQAFITFEYTKGIHLLDDKNPTELDERYKKYTLDINFMKSFNPFKYSFDFHLQHTKDQLFSTNQISIGGPYSVRGYKEESIDGNRGFYYRNELTYLHLKKVFGYFQPSLYFALDGGWIKKEKDTTGGSLLGEAIGIKLNSKLFLFDMYYSKALRTNDVTENKNFLALQLVYKF